jgi:hypothetical protein
MGLWCVWMPLAAELLWVLRPPTVVALAQALVQVTFSRSDRTLTLALPCAGPIFCQLSGAPADRLSSRMRPRLVRGGADLARSGEDDRLLLEAVFYGSHPGSP